MEERTKVAIAAGVGVLGLGTLIIAWAKYKQKVSNFEKAEKEAEEKLEELGVSAKTLDDMVKEEDHEDGTGFMKELYCALRYNKNVDIDILESNGFLDAEARVFVQKTNYKGKDQLDFLLQLPNYTQKGYGKAPWIGDYLRAFPALKTKLWENYAKFSDEPLGRLEGYVGYSIHANDGNPEPLYSRVVKIPKEVYESYSDGNHDGLTRFYEDISRKRIDEDVEAKLESWLNSLEEDESDHTMKVNQIFLAFKISFPMATTNRKHYGIDLAGALNCCRYITEKFEVSRDDSNYVVTYDHLMLTGIDDAGRPSLVHFYEADENGLQENEWFY